MASPESAGESGNSNEGQVRDKKRARKASKTEQAKPLFNGTPMEVGGYALRKFKVSGKGGERIEALWLIVTKVWPRRVEGTLLQGGRLRKDMTKGRSVVGHLHEFAGYLPPSAIPPV